MMWLLIIWVGQLVSESSLDTNHHGNIDKVNIVKLHISLDEQKLLFYYYFCKDHFFINNISVTLASIILLQYSRIRSILFLYNRNLIAWTHFDSFVALKWLLYSDNFVMIRVNDNFWIYFSIFFWVIKLVLQNFFLVGHDYFSVKEGWFCSICLFVSIVSSFTANFLALLWWSVYLFLFHLIFSRVL